MNLAGFFYAFIHTSLDEARNVQLPEKFRQLLLAVGTIDRKPGV
jgi:hypothetical protein